MLPSSQTILPYYAALLSPILFCFVYIACPQPAAFSATLFKIGGYRWCFCCLPPPDFHYSTGQTVSWFMALAFT